MVTASPPKPPPKTKRETWQDWLPDVEPTLTIDDVIARLRERGVENVTVEHIRIWQRERVLPAPIRRQVGSGKGGIRALYPPQAVDAIAEIRPLQQEGVRLRQINAYLARMFGLNRGPISHPLSGHAAGTSSVSAELTATPAPGNAALRGTPTEITTHTHTVRQSATISVSPNEDTSLLEAIRTAAADQAQRTGASIRQVEVTFIDTREKKHSYVFDL